MKVKVNPDKKKVAEVRKKLKENDGYCPCSLVKTEETKCKCKSFREQIERGEPGQCRCGLYVAEQDAPEEQKCDTASIDTQNKEIGSECENKLDSGMPKSLINQLVKIKDSARLFCGGRGIPEWVRNAELYISSENENGTVVIADSNTTFDVGSLYLNDVEILGKERGHVDSGKSFEKIDVRIMGVPSRIDNIRVTQKRLGIPDEKVFIDYDKEGCLKNAMKAWSYPTDKEFVLVLQDDVELCDYFVECCDRIVNAHPDAIISLFNLQMMRKGYYPRLNDLVSPYIHTGKYGATGQGIIMRAEWIEDCLSGWLESGEPGDDVNINLWAKKAGIPIITTIPTTLQHIGDISVDCPGRVIGRSEFYKKNAATADWDNPYVTSITIII